MPLDISIVVIIIILLFLIVYYYISIYIKTRKLIRNPTKVNVSQMAMAKYEKRIAVTTGLLTAALLISYTPLISMILFRDFFPVLSGSSFFLWSMTLTELNSLFNPVLYCCRNREIAHAMLELLGRQMTGINRNAFTQLTISDYKTNDDITCMSVHRWYSKIKFQGSTIAY